MRPSRGTGPRTPVDLHHATSSTPSFTSKIMSVLRQRPGCTLSRRFTVALLLAGIPLVGCRSGDTVAVASPRYTVELSVPGQDISAVTASPDGALFVGLDNGEIYRRYPAGSDTWEKIATSNVMLLNYHAPSRHTFFATQQGSAVVHRWRAGAGLQAMATPLSDSVAQVGHRVASITLYNIWGRGPDDVYAVGSFASIMHFDGHRWSTETNPLVPYAFTSTRASLWSVGGDRTATFVAGSGDLLTRTARGWELVVPPSAEEVAGWELAATLGNGTLVTGRKRNSSEFQAFHLERGTWTSFSPALRDVRGAVNAGSSQPDGSVVFWTDAGEVVHVTPRRDVTIYTGLPLGLSGAAFVDGRLYVAGRAHGRALVLHVHAR